MRKVLRIQPERTVFPIWVRTKINYKDSLAQDIDLVKTSILYIVFSNRFTHEKYPMKYTTSCEAFLYLMKLPGQTVTAVPAALFSPFLLAGASVPVPLSSPAPAICLHGAGLCCIPPGSHIRSPTVSFPGA